MTEIDVADKFEPGAKTFFPHPRALTDAAVVSAALSLKRIADALAPTEGLRIGEQIGQDLAANIEGAFANCLHIWLNNR